MVLFPEKNLNLLHNKKILSSACFGQKQQKDLLSLSAEQPGRVNTRAAVLVWSTEPHSFILLQENPEETPQRFGKFETQLENVHRHSTPIWTEQLGFWSRTSRLEQTENSSFLFTCSRTGYNNVIDETQPSRNTGMKQTQHISSGFCCAPKLQSWTWFLLWAVLSAKLSLNSVHQLLLWLVVQRGQHGDRRAEAAVTCSADRGVNGD